VRLLVLDGTQFVGRALVEAALAAGDQVTLFHRGVTNAALFPGCEHLLGDRDGDLEALRGGAWDACVDVSGYLPRVVRSSAELLRDAVGRYVFVSTISVFADLAVPRDESGPVQVAADPASEDVMADYGALKALCEDVVREVLGERSTIVRPGFVAGPHDHTGRLTWWVHRAARGGRIVVPRSIAARMQFIDARDLADFTLLCARAPHAGTFNATGPLPAVSLLDVLHTAAALTGETVTPVVVDDAVLTAEGLGFDDLPLWVDDAAWAAWAEVVVAKAIAAGLRFRPLVETVEGALRQASTTDAFGLTPERERELLATLDREGQPG